MKTLTKKDVEEAFDEILEETDKATSLEVKERLRSKGFWATQEDVGSNMREIADEKDIYWDYNGIHRQYHKDFVSIPQNLVSANSAPSSKKKNPISPQDREPIANASTGDWKCTAGIAGDQLFFKGSITSPQARYAYSLKTDTPYVEVRSYRI